MRDEDTDGGCGWQELYALYGCTASYEAEAEG